MKLIDKKQHTDIEALKDKYYYVPRKTKEYDIHYIFIIRNLLNEYPLIYKIDKGYMFCIPQDNKSKCFCYDISEKLELEYNEKLYEMDRDEFVDTFRVFVYNDGNDKNSIPSKLIQDKVG